MQAGIERGIESLFSRDPAQANYPIGYATRPNRIWFKFSCPLGYVTGVFQNLEVLTALGCGHDPRLVSALELVLSKQDSRGHWKLAYTYNGETWVDVEGKGKPSKWITLRALRILKRTEATGARQ